MILKLIGTEAAINVATSFSNSAVLVRVFNNSSSAGVVNLYSNATTLIANVTVGPYSETFVEKMPTDLIEGSSDMTGVPVAYRY